MELPCKDCVSGYILPGEPKGSLVEGAYFSPATHDGSPTSSNKETAIVILTDIFGLEINNPKILADSFAASLQCDVYVPDLFNGHPPISEHDLAPYIPDVPGQRRGLVDTLKWILVNLPALPGLFFNRPSVGRARAERFIEQLKSKGYSQVGAVGYCFGAGIALNIATHPNLANAVVACHAAPVDIGEVRRAVVPLCMLCSDEDEWLPVAKRTLAEVALRENSKTPSKLVVFSGTRHGFATRPNLGIPKVREGFEGAFQEAVSWFKLHLF